SDPSAGWGLWAIGAAAAAWALRSVPNASVGVVVACIWGCAHIDEHRELMGLVPLVATVPFFALLYLERSRALFGLTSISFIILAANATVMGFDTGFGLTLGLLACAAALLAFSLTTYFERDARTLGVLALAAVAYMCSFHEIAREFLVGTREFKSFSGLVFIVPLLGAALYLVVRNAGKLRDRPTTRAALVGIPVILIGLAFGDEVIVAIVANITLALLVFTSIASAARTLQRAPFWFGSLLGGIVILSRFLEFETELWLKALVFVGCGIAVILFGIGFERRLRHAV
ncbi:MAG: hypothetical protein JRH17_22550, partial [Deltaproteobacteria bacterium]|nr:hypothetical protein [Deltaproteobacteria bacterium]